VSPLGPADTEGEALQTDRYLEALLVAREEAVAARATELPEPVRLDPAIAAASGQLRRHLVRVHPSFRFEDRLARRLGDVAGQLRLAAAAGSENVALGGAPLPFPFPAGVDPASDALDAEAQAPPVPRPILIGGAVAASAISIGAALVAWRLGRPGLDPMARAVRAAHQLGAGRPVGID
jgi:hypothetical protein